VPEIKSTASAFDERLTVSKYGDEMSLRKVKPSRAREMLGDVPRDGINEICKRKEWPFNGYTDDSVELAVQLWYMRFDSLASVLKAFPVIKTPTVWPGSSSTDISVALGMREEKLHAQTAVVVRELVQL